MKAADTPFQSTSASSSRRQSIVRLPTAAAGRVLALGSTRCEQIGLRLTLFRCDPPDVPASEQKPLGVYGIAGHLGTRLQRRGEPKIAYRGLDSLVTTGLVTRLESRNAYVLCAHPAKSAHR